MFAMNNEIFETNPLQFPSIFFFLSHYFCCYIFFQQKKKKSLKRVSSALKGNFVPTPMLLTYDFNPWMKKHNFEISSN